MLPEKAAAVAGEVAANAIPELATIDICIILGFLLLVTVVGYVMSNVASKGLGDYFLGGRSIPWYVLGISTATSNFDMSGTMIIVAIVFCLGLRGFFVEIRGGVGLSLAFLLVFLSKWLRRSRVMTSAEWMKIRFGTDKAGKAAHLLSAIANTVLSLGMIIYFCKGSGKFLTNFLPVDEFTATSIMVLIGLFYTLMSGLYGVVFTDVVQMILLNFTAIYISFKAFSMRHLVTLPDGFLNISFDMPKGLGLQLLAKDEKEWAPILGCFGICIFMYVVRTTFEGCGGVGGYTDQRFFAAKSEREAGLLTLEAIILSFFRWTMVAGLVVMGYYLVQQGGPMSEVIKNDPEQVLPVVLSWLLPVGIKGIVIAGLIAAAMSTFDSTLNAGASYMVKDVYQSYLRPEADEAALMWASRAATVALCVAGVLLAAVVPNINTIWGLLTMGLGAGLFVPLFLRWYWPRFNGWGFAAGTGFGMIAGFVFNGAMVLPLYHAFPLTVLVSFLGCAIGTYMTPKVKDEVLVNFYMQINPWGFWGEYAQKAKEEGLLTEKEGLKRTVENLNDVIALCFAVPFQISILIAGMCFVFQSWNSFAAAATMAAFSGVGLYFFWYQNLKSEEECTKDDEYYDEKVRQIIGEVSAPAGH